MDYWFGPHINTHQIDIKPPITSNSKWRYSLVIPFKNRQIDGPTAYIVMKNPSQAGRVVNGRIKSDKTINKLCVYFYVRNYSKVIILNLASRYATYLSDVDHQSFLDLVAPESEWRANDRAIRSILKQFRPRVDLIAVGWGGKNKIKGSKEIYDRRISMVVRRLLRYTSVLYMYPSNTDYPVHPASDYAWNDWEDLVPYIHTY